MRDDDSMMNDDEVGDAVVQYFDANPELLNAEAPARDLWPAIEARIEARVLPLARQRAPRRTAWLPSLAAAAALVIASSGITYLVVREDARQSGDAASGHVAATTQQDGGATNDETIQATEKSIQPGQERASAANDDASGDVSSKVAHAHAELATSDRGNAVRSTYDDEITRLRGALEARRDQLDPATVSTIEENLRVIDRAIGQARRALAKDPKSGFLNDQLDKSLAKKTDLLRAAALLPSA